MSKSSMHYGTLQVDTYQMRSRDPWRVSFQAEPTFLGVTTGSNGHIVTLHYMSEHPKFSLMNPSPHDERVKIIEKTFVLLEPGDYIDDWLKIIGPIQVGAKPKLFCVVERPKKPALVVTKSVPVHAGMMVPRFWEPEEKDA